MTERTTLDMLLEVHGTPTVRLADVCEKYFGNKHYQARIRANKNALPVPAFRVDPDSHKSPWMVTLKDIAAFLDAKSAAATKSWKASQE
jgi:hypothetical protein